MGKKNRENGTRREYFIAARLVSFDIFVYQTILFVFAQKATTADAVGGRRGEKERKY